MNVNQPNKIRPRFLRTCPACKYFTNRYPEDEQFCPNDGTELVIDPEAPSYQRNKELLS